MKAFSSLKELLNLLYSERGSFLIPEDIEQRLSRGTRNRYDNQYSKYHGLKFVEQTLQRMIDLINKYRRSYDQEGYILLKNI